MNCRLMNCRLMNCRLTVGRSTHCPLSIDIRNWRSAAESAIDNPSMANPQSAIRRWPIPNRQSVNGQSPIDNPSMANLQSAIRQSAIPQSAIPQSAICNRQSPMTETLIRYSAAACQTDLPNPVDRRQMAANTDRMLAMIDAAVAGAAPFLPVRLIVFPEFAHAAPIYPTVAELGEKLAVEIPNEHTDRLHRKAREHDVYIQSGTMIEADRRWPRVLFNTSCLIGPHG